MYGLNYQIKERKTHEFENDQKKNNRKKNSNYYYDEIKNYEISRRIKLTLFSSSFRHL